MYSEPATKLAKHMLSEHIGSGTDMKRETMRLLQGHFLVMKPSVANQKKE
jgi:hypothetical protein